MHRVAPHALFAFLPAALAFLGLAKGGGWLFLATGWSLGLAVLLDMVVPPAGDRAPASMAERRWMGVLTWAVLPVVAGLILYGLHVVGTRDLAWWEWIGAAASVGTVAGGVGIVAAHELVHRRHAWERGLGVGLLALVLYAHFRIEHVHGHHRRIATPDDPATARLGESVWGFYARTVPGQWRSAWHLEAERLVRRGHAVWGPRNRMLHYVLIQGALLAGAFALSGWAGVLFLVWQAVAAVQLLETVNYVEHYGLRRGPGRQDGYEAVRPVHSWDSGHRVTNWSLFNLGLHADHHTHAGKPFAELGLSEEAPKMPAGYSGMVLLALVPPLWHRVMDPRVERWRAARAA
ncbi:MAG TPA: alkane 1-monooxygenase [Azospirillaceae bacterium]|nr:alkane 1-monooxygenase [Azospirillaceae bacterium]